MVLRSASANCRRIAPSDGVTSTVDGALNRSYQVTWK
jgi:hypothetical protein